MSRPFMFQNLENLRNILILQCGIYKCKIRDIGGTHSIQWGGKQVCRILNWLYRPECYRFLYRKTIDYKCNRLKIPVNKRHNYEEAFFSFSH